MKLCRFFKELGQIIDPLTLVESLTSEILLYYNRVDTLKQAARPIGN